MKLSNVKSVVKARIKAKIMRPFLLEGSPGLGKTQIVAQIAKELGLAFRAIHAPLMQPEDYGMPIVSADKSRVSFLVPAEKFPIEGSDCPDSGILLIDELSQADTSGQKILANLIQEREIHGKKLKPNWFIVATGNRAQDRSGANRLLAHLSSRLTRQQVDVSLDDWTTWAIASGVKIEVIAFLRFRPELLSNFDPKNEINATPRAWVEGVGASLGNIDKELEHSVFSGDVGEGPAAEFLAFVKIFRELPNPDAILLDPSGSDVPKDAATRYAIAAALAARVTDKNFGRALTYIQRLPAEFSVMFVLDCQKRCPAIASTKDFISWASGPAAKLLA